MKEYYNGHVAGINMRKAALCAGIAQLLTGIFAVAPELFGVGQVPVPNEFLDWAFRLFMLVSSSILAIFFFVVYRKVKLLNCTGRVRFASVVTAAVLAVENALPSYATVRGAIAAADNALGWEYHPFKQLAYVLVPTIPTLAVISLIAFLLAVFYSSLKTPEWEQSTTDRSGSGVALRLASFAAAVASTIALVWFLYAVMAGPQLTGPLRFRLLLRLVTLVSLVVFFLVLGANQPSGTARARVQY